MKVYDQILIHIQKLCQHFIRKLRSQNLQIGDCANRYPHLECLPFFKYKAGRCHIILCAETGPDHGTIIKLEIGTGIRIKCFIHNLKPLHTIQGICRYTKHLEIIQDIRLDTFQLRFRQLDILRFDRKRDIF